MFSIPTTESAVGLGYVYFIDNGHRMSRLILERGVRFTDDIFSALSVVSA